MQRSLAYINGDGDKRETEDDLLTNIRTVCVTLIIYLKIILRDGSCVKGKIECVSETHKDECYNIEELLWNT